ncbi:MAG: (Fe-S)-binding protein [Dehalococcoidales bacterium]|nr:(Fe-S)-binding protein [Dehalococcoidales bacterium]
MVLEDYRSDMEMCCRCSICKFIPLERLTENRYSYVCPSIARYGFQAYSGAGRMAIGISLLENRIELSDKLTDVVYNCQMCGACDISCKYAMDMEVLEPINEMRIECVNKGRTLPVLNNMVENMQKQGTMIVNNKKERGEWAHSMRVFDAMNAKVEVLFHAGCRVCSDKSLWKSAQDGLSLIQKSGVNVGILGDRELCCGGRAYQMGYQEDFLKQAKKTAALVKKSGATVLVTPCADCYYAFNVLYDKFGLKGDLEVLHTTEYLARLIKSGKLKPSRNMDIKVTYHDPCHLGRLGEPYIHWSGKPVEGNIRIFDPPKEFRRGSYGVYDAPRNILASIPGLKLVEMPRTREYAWCCGAGGGVAESNPEFAAWTARERIDEADFTRAEYLVTACAGCEQTFNSALKGSSSRIEIIDINTLLKKAI